MPTPPITEQILTTLCDYLSQEAEVPSTFVVRLRALAGAGKMADSEAILAALAAQGEDDEDR